MKQSTENINSAQDNQSLAQLSLRFRMKPIPIEGLKYKYLATVKGEIFRGKNGKFSEIKGWEHFNCHNGKYYRRVELTKTKGTQQFYVQRLIAITFLGAPEDQNMIVRHGEGGSLDNSVKNLSWGTHQENQTEDRHRDGNYYRRGNCAEMPKKEKAPF